MSKYKNRNISETTNPIKSKFLDQDEAKLAYTPWVTQIKSNMAAVRPLKNGYEYVLHNSAVGGSI